MEYGKKEISRKQKYSSNMENNMKANSKMAAKMALANNKSTEINILDNSKWTRSMVKAL